MYYTVRSRDGKQAVYIDDKNGNYYIRYIEDKNEGLRIFKTNDWRKANVVWQMAGANQGEYEIVEEC